MKHLFRFLLAFAVICVLGLLVKLFTDGIFTVFDYCDQHHISGRCLFGTYAFCLSIGYVFLRKFILK